MIYQLILVFLLFLVSAGSSSIGVHFYKQISETSAGRYASVALPNTYDVVIVNVNYPDTYSDNGTSYSEKSSFYEFRYYSRLCQFYIYKNVSANSTFTNKYVPGQNAGISVLAFNIN